MPAIHTEKLRKQFGSFTAVKGIDFEVAEGGNFGMLGPNGAGKSTLIRMLTTLLLPTSGKAWVAGFDVRKQADEVRRSIGVIPQALTSDPDLTAAENLTFYAGLYGVPSRKYPGLVAELLESVDLAPWRDKLVGTFSGGMRRRLEIARSLVHQPKILFLDEPTTGLDPASRIAMWEMIRRVKAMSGLTIFLTTHYMEEADQLCDRIAIFDHGQIVVQDTPANLKAKVELAQAVEAEFGEITPEWLELLGRLPGADEVIRDGNRVILHTKKPMPLLAAVIEAAREGGVVIASAAVKASSLEDVFVKFTGKDLRDSASGSAKVDVATLYERRR